MELLLPLSLLGLAVAVVAAALMLRHRPPEAAGTVAAQLGEVRTRLDALAGGQAGLAAAARSLDGLDAAVGDLRRVLAVPRLRGAQGELWLEELLRDALPSGHVELQHRFRSGERVDAALRLRERLVPIDAKFPLEGWRRVVAADGADADRERRAFLRAVRAHVDQVAAKYILPDEGTTDFAIMYVPAEGVFYEAILRDEEGDGTETTLEYARRRRVLVASPHTLWAYLGAVAQGLRGVVMEAREREMLDALTALQREISAYFDATEVARRHLANAMRQLEDAERLGYRLQDRLAALLAGGIAGDLDQGTTDG
jgi:DNA recombination protein RmuC